MRLIRRATTLLMASTSVQASTPAYDVIVYGASGFTGRLAVEYLTDRYATSGLKWAIAGRSRERLDAVLQETKAEVPIIVADATDAASVDAMVAQTKVLLNYAGSPYMTKALPVVEACARHGTHYVDVTGEVALHRASLGRHDAKAKETGSLIVHSCGYDSIPSDLGYLLASDAYQERYNAQPERARLLTRGFEGGGISGGTIYTGLALLGYADELMTEEAKGLVEETLAKGSYPLNDVCGPETRDTAKIVEYDELRKLWMGPFVMAAANAPVVRRSMELLGRDVIPYEENSGNVYAVGALGEYVLLGVGAALMLFPPTRYLLKKYVLPTPGQGPSREARDAGKFASEVYAAGPAGIAIARVESGDAGDGGYKATARMSTEAALTLALDREKCAAGGVSTPAAAMGRALVDRLNASGMKLFVVEVGGEFNY